MKNFEYTIKDPTGIHARPAGNLVKLAKTFADTIIKIEKNGTSVEVTKLMKLMGLGVKCGDTVKFTFEGGNEDAAKEAIEKFMNENL